MTDTNYVTIDRDELKRLHAVEAKHLQMCGTLLASRMMTDPKEAARYASWLSGTHFEVDPAGLYRVDFRRVDHGREVMAYIAINDPDSNECGDWDVLPLNRECERLAMPGGGEYDLMAVAQHSRIVAAKDAEIAALRLGIDTAGEQIRRREAELAEALSAQPARQVGGDEREQFEVWAQRIGISTTRTPNALAFANGQRREAGDYIMLETLCAYAAWMERAALATAAVVMPERKDTENCCAGEEWEGHTRWNEALDAVARLNRNPIPVEMLIKLCAPQADHERLKISRLAAAIELRALLGKE